MTLKRLIGALVICAGLAVPAGAQDPIQFGIVTVLSTGACNTGACATFQAGQFVALGIDVAGTFTGTLTFEGTVDGATWRTITVTKLSDYSTATTATSAAQYTIPNIGLQGVRLRATAWTSGQANITATRGYATARLFSLSPTFNTVTASHFVGGDYTGTTYTATSGFLAPTGCTTVPYSFTGDTTTGSCSNGSGDFNIYSSGTARVRVVGADTLLAASQTFGWGSSGVSTEDVRLRRSATKTLTVDDGAGGAATVQIVGSIIGSGNASVDIGNAGGNNINVVNFGSGAAGVVFNNAARIKSGSGSPEGAVTAAVGSLWLRTDGGASTTLYVKESGSGNTGWIAK